ncbi:hypothetical protein OOJ91_33540 [Micromonospora lupini]|uniref:deazapurine DNA modification protein DpdA family protein n=1 Tax=Micromonospora lupini TaxID=285679 RepID=UPI00225AFF71|nr:hypothetical protein [Micromonospora lupini]MCX5070770.1 hypothetical protein [Micromonospora lupini]
MRFYLGTGMPGWLATVPVPLFISHRRLTKRKTLPRAIAPWALDSGGFTELSMFHEWRTTPKPYVAAVRRYVDEVGQLDFASQQDWMCEPSMLAKTGRTVEQHQDLTVANFVELRSLAPDLPIIPVLQGWRTVEYLRCVDKFAAAGVDLTKEPRVGIGSVCRRTSLLGTSLLISRLAADGIAVHGFGFGVKGLEFSAQHLASSDSMAWSAAGRREPGCDPGHKTEANCLDYALWWRGRVLRAGGGHVEDYALAA